ncbi:coiled-coil domain-containing protein 167-like isoform X2 [Hydra vulgaris]|uniref:Coiled-coil domain-containing protein 167 n=1 Tax=Hydra vulgaris TaxID=6087 RepID=A0ABM4CI92_HYDVU
MPSIISQIEFHEERLEHCEHRLDDIRVTLRKKDILDADRSHLFLERDQLTLAISNHKITLKSLRHENRRSMMVSVAVVTIIALVYLFAIS